MKTIVLQENLIAPAVPSSEWRQNYSACVGAGRACEGLRASWQKQLKQAAADCGFRYVRFHGLLTDDMHVCYRSADGTLSYSWQYVDDLFDSLLSRKVRPFVEFGFCPAALARGNKTQFWWQGRIDPPTNYAEWAALLAAACRHWLDRYGAQEVHQWYFEIWNEPNLNVFWNGTRGEYFALYAQSVRAIKAVDSALRVGGPTTSNFVPDDRFEGETEDTTKQKTHLVEDIDSLAWRGVWIKQFLEYCKEQALPVDFLSAHPYPTDFALDGVGECTGRTRKVQSLAEDVAWLKNALGESAYPDAELCLTEWSSSPSSRDFSHDHLPAACYIAKSCTAVNEELNCLSYWVFTDIFEELGGGHDAYHGGFGLLNYNGIPKPAYHAYRMLHTLGERLIAKNEDAIITTRQGKLRALVWNYSENIAQAVPMSPYPDWQTALSIQEKGAPANCEIKLEGLAPGAQVEVELLDAEHGTAITLWHQMGRPKNLTPLQEQQLRAAAAATQKMVWQADENGVLTHTQPLPPWALLLLCER